MKVPAVELSPLRCVLVQGVVSTNDGKVVRAFHRFTLVDQTGKFFFFCALPAAVHMLCTGGMRLS